MSSEASLVVTPPDISALVERARELGPSFLERARETELQRRLPDATAAALRASGLLGALVPKDFGGLDLEIRSVVETARELGRYCGNTAWCAAIFTLHNRIVASLPEAAQHEVFGSGPDAMVCGVFMPSGFARPVDGGFRLTGAWDFASGCDHAGHATFAALIRDDAEAAPRGMGTFLVRRADFRIDDNWHVAGLCGTGSKRVAVEDAFVPSDWMIEMTDGVVFGRRSSHATGGLPGNSVATLGLTGVPIGIAEGAIAAFQERLETRVRVTTGKTPEQQIGAQIRLADSCAEVDAAQLIALRDCEEMTLDAQADRTATDEQRGRYRRDAAWVFKTCARAVARLQPAAGAHGIFLDEFIQRAVRDTGVMSAHIVADFDAAAEAFVRARLGLPRTDPVT
jgi:alkylation response protein AidB-like acyl-CoA dehydrogenase